MNVWHAHTRTFSRILERLTYVPVVGPTLVVADYSQDGSVGLTGTVPQSLANLTDLQALDLGPNSLTGIIPEGLCHGNMRAFSMPGNRLSANLTHLLACKGATRIDLSYNQITGTLPDEPRWELYQLSGLALNDNKINGTIPRAVLQLPTLAFLNLGNNR